MRPSCLLQGGTVASSATARRHGSSASPLPGRYSSRIAWATCRTVATTLTLVGVTRTSGPLDRAGPGCGSLGRGACPIGLLRVDRGLQRLHVLGRERMFE